MTEGRRTAYETRCWYCDDTLDIRSKGVFQRAAGWVENRSAGGANAVALSERQAQWACGSCIARLRLGLGADQGRLT